MLVWKSIIVFEHAPSCLFSIITSDVSGNIFLPLHFKGCVVLSLTLWRDLCSLGTIRIGPKAAASDQKTHVTSSDWWRLYRFALRTFIHIFMTLLLCTFAQFSTLGQQRTILSLRCFQTHQLCSDGQTGTVLLSQFNLDGFGILGGLQGSGQVIWSYLKTDLIVLRGETFHLVLIKEVGLEGKRHSEKIIGGRHDHDKDLQDFKWLVASGEQDTYLWELTPHADPPVGHFPRQNEEQIVWSQSQDAALGQFWDGADDSYRFKANISNRWTFGVAPKLTY